MILMYIAYYLENSRRERFVNTVRRQQLASLHEKRKETQIMMAVNLKRNEMKTKTNE